MTMNKTKKKEKNSRNMKAWAVVLLLAVATVSLGSIFLYSESDVEFRLDSVESEDSHDHENTAELPETNGLVTGELYDGLFAEEFWHLGIFLYKIENLEEVTGYLYDGSIYTFESEYRDCEKIDGQMFFGESQFQIRNPSSFDRLLEIGFVSEEDGGNRYYKKKDKEGNDILVVYAGEDEATIFGGGIKKVFVGYLYFGDRDACLSLADAAHLSGGIGASSSISDVVEYYGTPTYVDLYHGRDKSPYVMLYYSHKNGGENTVDEMSIVFVEDENAEAGYTLSEITVSVF